MRLLASTAIAALLAMPATAPAQETIDLPPELTEGFYVTLEEVRANSAEVYKAFAGPGGGPIPKREFVAADIPPDVVPGEPDREMLERLFGLLDADGDGELTRAEWNEQIEKDLSFADEDEDGRITLRELAEARENLGIGDAIGMIF